MKTMTAGNLAWTKRHRGTVNNLKGWLFAAPVILGFVIFVLGPMIISLVMSFTDYKVAQPPGFIGLDNYVKLFSGEDPYFFKSFGVTFYYALLAVPLQLLTAFLLALLLNQKVKGLAIFRTIFYLPTMVPAVALCMVWLWMYDPDMGLFNTFLNALGIPRSMWIYDAATVIPCLAFMSCWTTGGTMLIFLAALQDVPRSYYESMEVDGARWHQKLIYITIPLTTPTIFFNLIMGIISSLQTFTQAYIMTEGGPNNSSLFYSYYLYREAFQFGEMGSACAIAWVLFLVVLALTMIVFTTSDKWVYYEGETK